MDYIYDETYAVKGWFDAHMTSVGWFDQGFTETGGEPPVEPDYRNQGIMMMGVGA